MPEQKQNQAATQMKRMQLMSTNFILRVTFQLKKEYFWSTYAQ